MFDLEVLGKISKKHNLIFNVDNCFATPYLQQPVNYGADIITHSATKFIDGQGRVLGGVVCGKKNLVNEARENYWKKLKIFLSHKGKLKHYRC